METNPDQVNVGAGFKPAPMPRLLHCVSYYIMLGSRLRTLRKRVLINSNQKVTVTLPKLGSST